MGMDFSGDEGAERLAHALGYNSKADWDTKANEHQALWDTPGLIEWHTRPDGKTCQGRHGVIRGVTKQAWQKISPMLEYFMGSKPYWAKKISKDVWDIEFAYQCVGGPKERVNQPWEWCGTSILFEDRRAAQLKKHNDVVSFKIGTLVEFTNRHGNNVRGMVTRYTTRVVVTEIGTGNTWYVPPRLLRRI